MNETQLVRRISEMHQKQGKLKGEEKKLTRQLTEGILEEKDTSRLEGDIARLSVHCDGVAKAIAHAERELESVRAENEQKEKDSLEKQLKTDLDIVQAELVSDAKLIIQMAEKNVDLEKTISAIRDQAHNANFADIKSRTNILFNIFPFGDISGLRAQLTLRRPFSEQSHLMILEGAEFTPRV